MSLVALCKVLGIASMQAMQQSSRLSKTRASSLIVTEKRPCPAQA